MMRCATASFTMVLIIVLVSAGQTAQAFSKVLKIPETVAQDTDLLIQFWSWLSNETGAPDYLPAPDIVVENLPNNVSMGLFYPTRFDPDKQLRIVVSKRAIDNAIGDDRLVLIGGIAHELVHYFLLMKEHDWNYERIRFEPARHGHCDVEFQRLTRHIGQIIWNAYHSNAVLRTVEQMVRRSCWEEGDQLSRQRGK